MSMTDTTERGETLDPAWQHEVVTCSVCHQQMWRPMFLPPWICFRCRDSAAAAAGHTIGGTAT